MTTTLSDIRYTAEQNVEDQISNERIINWCNQAQAEFMLRIFIPASTTLAIDTTTLTYTGGSLSSIRQIRRLRLQSDIDNGYNRDYNPVYTLYNSKFEVPVPFGSADTLLIDYYGYLTTFTDVTDTIDLDDRFKPLYTSFVESMYYLLPSTINKLSAKIAQMKYQIARDMYEMQKKQVSDFYIIAKGIEKPKESGW